MKTPAAWAATLVILAGAGAGCGLFRRPAPQPPTVVILQPPILLAGPTVPPPMPLPYDMAPAAAMPAVDFSFDLDIGPPPRRAATPTAPAPDHAGQPSPPAEQPPPQMGVALSPAQQAAAHRRAQARLAEVQRELMLLNARSYTGAAEATRSQVGEYVRQAQEALDQGDWQRSQNLSDKADTLARYLLGQ